MRVFFLVDKCSHMQNLREDIYDRLVKSNDRTVTEEARKRTVSVGISYLRRYFCLICFAAFLLEQKPESKMFSVSFKQWMIQHQEIYSLLNNMELK
jgi:hypothetical protein